MPPCRTMTESLSALPETKRTDPGFFIGNMIPTCISEDVEAAKAVNRRTLTNYGSCPLSELWKEAGYVEEMDAIEKAIAENRRDDVPKFFSDRWLADNSLFGPAAKVREGVEAWRAGGCAHADSGSVLGGRKPDEGGGRGVRGVRLNRPALTWPSVVTPRYRHPRARPGIGLHRPPALSVRAWAYITRCQGQWPWHVRMSDGTSLPWPGGINQSGSPAAERTLVVRRHARRDIAGRVQPDAFAARESQRDSPSPGRNSVGLNAWAPKNSPERRCIRQFLVFNVEFDQRFGVLRRWNAIGTTRTAVLS